uniref:Uncharacterized protein n=1 Tax=Rhizophora mucronata TaxID=61149 RepID=A0A2P2MZN7_RHIMU
MPSINGSLIFSVKEISLRSWELISWPACARETSCIAATNSLNPRNPWRLESASAHICLSWGRETLDMAKNMVASLPVIRPSPSESAKSNQSL